MLIWVSRIKGNDIADWLTKEAIASMVRNLHTEFISKAVAKDAERRCATEEHLRLLRILPEHVFTKCVIDLIR